MRPPRTSGIAFDMYEYSTQHSSPNREDTNLSSAVKFDPDEGAIAELAYYLWAERGRPEGSPEEDWFRAKELLTTVKAFSASSILP
jgi:hypothetical protein